MSVLVGRSLALVLIVTALAVAIGALGAHHVDAQDGESDPEMTITPDCGRPGELFNITGTGFPANQPVSVTVGVLEVAGDDVYTDGDGDVSISFVLPSLPVSWPP